MEFKIELKSVKFYESRSEETNNFTANLYINGKKVGIADNDGKGGETMVRPLSIEGTELIKKCNNHLKTQPDIVLAVDLSVECNLVNTIDVIFEKWLEDDYEKKFQAKLKRQFVNKLVFTTDPIEQGFVGTYYTYPYKLPIADIERVEGLRAIVLKRIKEEIGKGARLLNTNIDKKYIKGIV